MTYLMDEDEKIEDAEKRLRGDYVKLTCHYCLREGLLCRDIEGDVILYPTHDKHPNLRRVCEGSGRVAIL